MSRSARDPIAPVEVIAYAADKAHADRAYKQFVLIKRRRAAWLLSLILGFGVALLSVVLLMSGFLPTVAGYSAMTWFVIAWVGMTVCYSVLVLSRCPVCRRFFFLYSWWIGVVPWHVFRNSCLHCGAEVPR